MQRYLASCLVAALFGAGLLPAQSAFAQSPYQPHGVLGGILVSQAPKADAAAANPAEPVASAAQPPARYYCYEANFSGGGGLGRRSSGDQKCQPVKATLSKRTVSQIPKFKYTYTYTYILIHLI